MTYETYGKSNFHGRNICNSSMALWLKDATLLRNGRILFWRSVLASLKPYKNPTVRILSLIKNTRRLQIRFSRSMPSWWERVINMRTLYRIEWSLDETQQYLRRDCLEITGVTIKSDNPTQIDKEIGSLIGAEIKDSDIAAYAQHTSFLALKIPWLLNFYREKRERKFTKGEGTWWEKKSHLPSQSVAETSPGNSKIFTNESVVYRWM